MNPILRTNPSALFRTRQQAILSASENPAPPKKLLSKPDKNTSPTKLRKAFDQFLGEVYFGQMLKAMRQTVGKPAYVYGGMAEDIFTQQLDQVLTESLAKQMAPQFSEPMFELFTLCRQ